MTNWFLETLSHILVHHSTMTYSFHSISIKCFVFSLWLPLLLLLSLLLFIFMHTECDQTFVSRPGGPQNGTFAAPAINNPSNHSRQCLYIFLAGPGQRVEITFTSFNLRGSPPEYVKYSEKNSHFCLFTFLIGILFLFTQQWSGRWRNSIVSIK